MSSLPTHQIAVSQWHSASNSDSVTTPLASVLHVKCSTVGHTEGNVQYLTHSPLHYCDASRTEASGVPTTSNKEVLRQ